MKNTKLKILAAGDIHGDSALTKRLADLAVKEDVDLVVLTGDLTMFDQSHKNLIGPFERAKKKVLLLHGNHETIATTEFLSEKYSNTKNLHGYSVKFGDVGIFGAGGVTDVGPFSKLSEKEMFELLEKGFENIKESKVRIMATHAHPANTKMERLSEFVSGSSGIEKAIKNFQPDIALCSHIHEAWNTEEKIGKTRLINVGREGTIIEIG